MERTHDGRTVVRRTAARVLLIDGADRLLLVQGSDPYRPEVGRWWFSLGGGVEDGETLEAAALREVREESGIDDVTLGPLVWRRSAEFPFLADRYVYQREHYFVGWTTSTDTRDAGWTEYERQQLSQMRWWGADELASTDEVIAPAQLPALLPAVLRGEYPAVPVELDTHGT
ncbi:MAG: NUDIX domain-containing protein [Actinocatenispora sp.]